MEGDFEDEALTPSKSELKRQMHELQDLGAALATLSKERLAALALPEKLLEAVAQWQTIRAHGGRRRQLQYIGKLMRAVDPEPIRRALDEQHRGSAEQTLQLHKLETLRLSLLDEGPAGQQALTDWLAARPDVDIQRLRSLIRAARKDAQTAPEERAGRAFRELFRFLKEFDT